MACAAVKKNSLSNSFFGLFLSRKSSPVNLEINKPRYTMLPVAINKTQTVMPAGNRSPETPIISQAIRPDNGVARNFPDENSSLCTSRVLSISLISIGDFVSVGKYRGKNGFTSTCP